MAARGAGRASGRAELLAADVRGVGRAAALLGQGALVAFPTETVYGLGALALDGAAARFRRWPSGSRRRSGRGR